MDDISAFWDGRISVSGINFHLFHPITVDSVTLEDRTNKVSLQAKGVTLLFKKWPSSNPELTGIELGHLDVIIDIVEGKPEVSLRQPVSSSSDQQESSFSLENFTVINLAIHLSNAKKDPMVLEDLSFSAVREQTGYALSLKQRSSSDSDSFLFSGNMNADDSQSNFNLLLVKHISRHLTAEIQSLLGLSFPFQWQGNLSANIMFAGTLKNFVELKPTGTILLKDGSVFSDQKVWAEKLNASIQVDGPRVQVEKWTANSFAGQIQGALDAEIRQKKLAQFQGTIKGEDIQASEVIGVQTDTEQSEKGVLAFDYTFVSDKGDLQQMKGQGTLSLEQVDYHILPVAQEIIKAASGNGSKKLERSNAIAIFETSGPTVTFSKARLSNNWVAIEGLRGGTLDLKTGSINSHVIVAPIKQIRELLNSIPVVKLFMGLKDNLTCLHVQGNRSDLSKLRITKEPVRDVAAGTLEFFQSAATTGGGLWGGIKDSPKALLKDTDPNNAETNSMKGK